MSMLSARQLSKALSAEQIKDQFGSFNIEIIGEPKRQARRVDPVEDVQPESLVFCGQASFLQQAIHSNASLIVTPKPFIDLAPHTENKTFLIARSWDWLMADLLHIYVRETPYRSSINGVHTSAVVHPTAKIASSASIGPNSYIGANVAIGEHSFIGANSVVEDDTQIGSDTVIHPLTYIGPRCSIGSRCEIHSNCVIGKEGYGYAHNAKNEHRKIPHIGTVVLEDDVHIGAHVAIDRGTFGETRICKGTKLDNQIHLAHNSFVGENSLLTARFAMAGSSRIGKNFVTGGSSNVTGHIEIADNVQIAGMSGVTKSIEKPGQYGGYPLMPLQQFLKTKAATMNLVELRKQVGRILKHLKLEE